MKLFHSTEEIPAELRGGALTIGNFDGVHKGHGRIIQRLKHWATEVGGPATVFTFEPHPVRLLRPDLAPPPLTWTERKAELLFDLGVDVVIAYRTTPSLLALTYQQFFQQIIREQLAASAIVEGPNFFFGHDREGNVDHLSDLCREHEIRFEIVEPISLAGALISSTRIRECVRSGDVHSARTMLTQPYRIRGLVVHGAGRGAPLGFPTANLDAIDTLVPALGVYAGTAVIDGQLRPAAIHIGPSPTFSEKQVKVEVHLLDFEQTLYGEVLEIDFHARLRGIHQFDSAAELKTQLTADIEKTRQITSEVSSNTTNRKDN